MKRFDQAARIRNKIAALRVRFALLHLYDIGMKAGFRGYEPRDGNGNWTRGSGTVRVLRKDRTGNSKIDAKTDQLVDIVSEVVQRVGPGQGATYGVQIHVESAAAIRAYDLPGIGPHGVEQSFSAGDVVRYGLDGSIRTDIVLRNGRTVDAPIIAVWDIKTGSARLSPARVRQIREELDVDDAVPVIELHIKRGITVKFHF